MKFLIFSHVIHVHKDGLYYGYGPYVKEMNLWAKYVDELWVLAPLNKHAQPDPIDLAYIHPKIKFIEVPSFQITSLKHLPVAVWASLVVIGKGLYFGAKADHLHLRCPGNMGLLACLVQAFFPWKKKTAKYAGNWDRSARKPWSYRIQQWILNNTFFTHRMKVLAYGSWSDQSKNVLPFFTASYSHTQISPVSKPEIVEGINLIFVGSMTVNKSPETSYWVAKELINKGFNCALTFLGKGPELERLKMVAKSDNLEDKVKFLGNVSGDRVIEELKKAHFLVFASQSEGWPKAVAEAMFWGCIPVTTPVSCVPEMLGFGERGYLINENRLQLIEYISEMLNAPSKYSEVSEKAMAWSRKFTLETFEEQIACLI